MSSETSTEARARKPAAPFEAWQLFTLAGLISAAIVAFFASAQPPSARIFLILTIFAAAAVGIGALRMLSPLTGIAPRERRASLSERTRAVLEREKALALRSIKELEFDRAMGKVSDSDWQEMSGRLRTRATRLMRQLDAGAGYRQQIERDLAKRLGTSAAATMAPGAVTRTGEPASPQDEDGAATSRATRTCASCSTDNDTDAKFCKACGQKL